jgi:UDP-N-acetylglucosamine 2-epimerase (non-hydrolysing)
MIFPIHPRTSQALRDHGIGPKRLSRVTVVEPLSALECLSYEKHARLILTDSGCIQEEAYLFGVPCVTIRENTERVETFASGANVLTGFDTATILKCVDAQLTKHSLDLPPVYGDYGAGERIVTVLLEGAAS